MVSKRPLRYSLLPRCDQTRSQCQHMLILFPSLSKLVEVILNKIQIHHAEVSIPSVRHVWAYQNGISLTNNGNYGR
jgi:hypothetical protein